MEPTESPRGTKRPLPASTAGDEDDDGAGRAAPVELKPRFPKGKKAKNRDPGAADAGGSGEGGAAAEDIDSLMNPELAAVRRARRRHRREAEDTQGAAADVRGFEVRYENLLTWSKRGNKDILMKMGILWNMQEAMKLRMPGWIVLKLTQSMLKRFKRKKDEEEEFQDLSSDDIGKIKRRIANMLEPGETIIQALKKLKSTSTDKRGKMTEGTKRMFDELTEAAMKLMENGEYNVYSDDRETFEREAEGYERLACARLGVPEVEDIFVDTAEDNQTTSLLEMDSGPSAANTSTTTATSNDDGSNFDMFGDNDDISDVNRDSDAKTVNSGSNPEPAPQNASGTSVAEKADNGSVDSDYVFDSTSGYYYSSSTGYYYDLTSGCYCSASTGTWYSYDEQTGAYKEIQDEQTGGTHKELQDGITK